MIKALAKVLVAASWADGRVSQEEINSLKDLLFQLPDMTARDWSELEIYLDSPVGEQERERLVLELENALASPRDRDLALAALEDIAQADGRISDNERVVLQEIEQALNSVDVSIFGRMGRLLSGPIERQSQAVAQAPNRERFLEDYIRNKIFYSLRLRLKNGDRGLDLPEEDLWKLSLAGGLMARIAYVDRKVSEQEREEMREVLQKEWNLGEKEAELVVEVAVSEVCKDMDYYRLSREFFDVTNEDERERFLKILFATAAADGPASHEEMEEIRTVSKVLKLSHKQFIDAKLSLPRERRAY
jgi:uncharacterized tellurite resistance protein B-like protein